MIKNLDQEQRPAEEETMPLIRSSTEDSVSNDDGEVGQNQENEESEPSQTQRGLFTHRFKAIFFINVACVSQFVYYSTMKVLLEKELVDALDIQLVRSIFLLLGSLSMARLLNVPLYIAPQDKDYVATRATIGIVGFVLRTSAIARLPLTVNNSISSTNPIWAALLGWVFLREQISCGETLALILSFCAVLCVTFATVGSGRDELKNDQRLLGALFSFLAVQIDAAVSILTRWLQATSFIVISFYYSAIALPCTVGAIGVQTWFSEKPVRFFTYGRLELCALVALAFLNFLSTNSKTIAQQNERSGFIGMFSYLGLVYTTISDYQIFEQEVVPLQLFGVAVIILINVWLVLSTTSTAEK